jgi:pimeloyl-ACP methyl ester carboxylesterase
MSQRWFDPFVEAGYTIWYVTRRRNMPTGHTVADMADDYAYVISEDLDGRVDLLVGESYGGMIAQYIAARHGACCGRVAIVVAAAEVSPGGKEVGSHLAAALVQGHPARVGRRLRSMRFQAVAPGGSAALSAPFSDAVCCPARTTRLGTSW